MWEVASGTLLKTLPQTSHKIQSLAISSNAEFVAIGGGNGWNKGEMKVWSNADGKFICEFLTKAGSCMSISISDRGDMVAASGHMNSPKTSLICWKNRGSRFRTQIQRLQGHRSWVNCCSISADGLTMVSGSHDGTIKIWDQSHAGDCSCVTTIDSCNMQVLASPPSRPTFKKDGAESSYQAIQNFAYHGVNWCQLTAGGEVLVAQCQRSRVAHLR